jgi:GNAT superfamily N-acetyltransferase
MPTALVIRPARDGDAAQLVELWIEFGTYYEALDPIQFQIPSADGLIEWTKAELLRERTRDETWLVAERSDQLLGFIWAQILRPDEGAARQILRTTGVTTLKVDALMVTDRERRGGVGTELMRAVEAWGVELGAIEAFVISYAHSPTSVPFYEKKMGYKSQTTGYWKPLGE